MTKRVQLVRDDNAGSNTFLGKDGEITVNTGNKSIHVHDGINQGGTEQARADLNNVVVASSSTAGKMSAAQASSLAQALLDIATNVVDIATNVTNIGTNTTNIATLTSDKADKIVPAATNNIATLSVSGNLQDSGDLLSDYFKLAGGNANFMTFMQTAAPVGWTKDTTHNNKAFRVVSGSVVNGGTDSFTTVFSKTATDSYTLLEADIPAHDHGASGTHAHNINSYLAGGSSPTYVHAGTHTSGSPDNKSTGAGGDHTHTSFGGSSGHVHGLANFDLQYVDLIVASKD